MAGILRSPLFHVTHVVARLDEALDCHRRLFARPTLDGGSWDVAQRHAIFTFVGDTWLEAMIPDRSGGIRAFVDAFGSHLHSIAFYVNGIDDIADALHAHRVRFYDSHGKPIEGAVPRHGPIPVTPGYRRDYEEGWESAVLYTNINDTHGMLELCEPSSFHPLPPRTPDPDMLQDGDDPLGLVGTSHHTMVTGDCDAATALWTDVFGAELVRRSDDDRTALVRVGDGAGTVVELVQPEPGSVGHDDLVTCRRPMLHRTTFRVRDLDAVRSHLAANDFAIESDRDGLVVTDPTTTAGARFGFTDLPVEA